MCGIVAILAGRDPVSAHALERATGVLHHRGPDGRRQWIAPSSRIGLGHTRLSIIDISTGDQPIASEDGRIHIVVNGEFYDHDRIQRELRERGHKLRTESDSEIAVHLYEELGTKCLAHLRGEFAFVLWDERNQVMFAARDRFGIKPLYYAAHAGALYLASEAKALFAAGVPAEWDHESFYQHAYVSCDQDRTSFKGVRQVPPGHFLLATPFDHKIVRYWDLNFPIVGATEGARSEAEWVEVISTGLREAVRLRLRADVPVGFYLSGGLDSSVVLGMAMQHLSAPPDAFTICFEGESFSEESATRETSEHLGLELHTVNMDQNVLAEHFSDAVWHAETIAHNANFVSRFVLSKLVRDKGYRVILSGEGADEVFAGYSHFRRDALLNDSCVENPADLVAALQESEVAARGIHLPVGAALDMDGVRRTLGFVPTWLEARSEMGARLHAVLSHGFRSAWSERDPVRVFLNGFDAEHQLTGREVIDQSAYLWAKAVFLNYILVVNGDHMEMGNSVEGRTPFLDHHLVEMIQGLPRSLKIKGMVEKYALREAARPFITDAAYRRRKHPFVAPPFGGDKPGRFGEMMQDVLRGDTLSALPFFDREAVTRLLDRALATEDVAPEEHATLSSTLMTVLTACVLQQRFGLG